jgi:hypothetical protein
MKADIASLVIFKKNPATVQADPKLYGDGLTYYIELSVNQNINRVQVNNIDFEVLRHQIQLKPGLLESTAEFSNGDSMLIYRPKTNTRKK